MSIYANIYRLKVQGPVGPQVLAGGLTGLLWALPVFYCVVVVIHLLLLLLLLLLGDGGDLLGAGGESLGDGGDLLGDCHIFFKLRILLLLR